MGTSGTTNTAAQLVENVNCEQGALPRFMEAAQICMRMEADDRRLDLPEFVKWCEWLDANPVEVLQRIVKG